MNKDLEKIQKRSAEVLTGYPEQKAELTAKLTEAERQARKAKADLDAAEDLAGYDAAAESLKRAELSIKFAKGAIDKLDGAPRMAESEYLKALTVCRGIMDNAASAYRVKAAALMDQLKALQDEYMQIAADTNETLEKLDEAANILQSKYKYKIWTYKDRPDKREPDKHIWLTYALRYEGYTPCRLATAIDDGSGSLTQDNVLTAAWQAVIKGYPTSNNGRMCSGY